MQSWILGSGTETMIWVEREIQIKSVGRLTAETKRVVLATRLLWKQATVCKHIQVYYRRNSYEMKRDIQGVEMSVHSFLNWNKSFQVPVTCQSVGKLATIFYFWCSLSPLDYTRNPRLMQFICLLWTDSPSATCCVCWSHKFGQARALRAELHLGFG